MSLYNLKALLILPYKTAIGEFTVSDYLFNEKWKTTFELYYNKNYSSEDDSFPDINTSNYTFISLKSKICYNGSLNEAEKWAKENNSSIILDKILSKVNKLLLHIKYAYPEALFTGNLRTISSVDLVYSKFYIEDKLIDEFVSTTYMANQISPLEMKTSIDLSCKITTEWRLLTRSVELFNHGYFTECLIVGFALLDETVQKFISEKMKNLKPEEANFLLRKIEKGRLNTYLGILSKLIIGESILDIDNISIDLKWLNNKRNQVMHNGEDCTKKEARKALLIIQKIIKILIEKNGSFHIPEKLEFWI